jgi:hypothetical protein
MLRSELFRDLLGPTFTIIPVADTPYYVSSLQGSTPSTKLLTVSLGARLGGFGWRDAVSPAMAS